MNAPIRAPAGSATTARRSPTRSSAGAPSPSSRIPDAGKTTLTEKLLLFGGAIQLAGHVKAKRNRRTTQSDWMAIEKERGISVVTSVMTFEYDNLVFNLLDTPGHEDFSEDTYRTLTAVDSAVMVIDAAKGIEARTRKLFEVCRLRDIPIVTFINKMDRESRDPFDLLDEIEKTLALDTTPVNWPVGRGRDFVGTIAVEGGGVRLLEGDAGRAGTLREMSIDDVAALNPNLDGAAIEERDRRWSATPASRSTGDLPRGPSQPGVLRLGAEELRRRRSARRHRPHGAVAARAEGRQAHRRGRRAEHVGLRVQDPGQHGPEPPRPHRVRAALLGQAHPRHEGQAGPHRQVDFADRAAVLLRAGPLGRRRGLCRRRGRHPEPRRDLDRRHADRGRGHQFHGRAELRAGNPAPRAAARRDEGEEAEGGACSSWRRRASCRCSARRTARRRWSAWSARCSSTCCACGSRTNTASK